MRRFTFGTTIIFFILALALVGAFYWFLGGAASKIASSIFSRPASFAFDKLEDAGSFFKGLANVRSLSSENEILKNSNFDLLSKLAKYEDLQQENAFLRSSLSLKGEIDRQFIDATIYNVQLGPIGYRAKLAKGAKNGVEANDVVVTESGVLVGRVVSAEDNFSNIAIVQDLSFTATVKTLGGETTGIVTGALDEGMYMDLVIQNDVIKEGDVLVTSGVDFFPPGLIVGVVTHVESIETQLFKKVRVRPSVEDLRLSRVLIIQAE